MGLIKQISEKMESLGGLGDLALSAFLRDQGFSEKGFRFMAVENSLLVFAVPEQGLAQWYNAEYWPSNEKKDIAEDIAKKYNLELYMPPDEFRNMSVVWAAPRTHHLEFCGKNSSENRSFAAIYPKYLKLIRQDAVPHFDVSNLFEDVCRLYL